MTEPSWTEEESETYRKLASVAVPARAEQLATLLLLLPFGRDDAFRVTELGCGEGALSHAMLDYFPKATVLALDGSESMLDRARSLLAGFGGRVEVAGFELTSRDWLDRLAGTDCVLSSLALHHLPDAEKPRLFTDIAGLLTERGSLLIADIIAPQSEPQRALFAEAYDQAAREASLARTGREELYDLFTSDRWNLFRYDTAAEEYPASLFDQLTWLKDAGLRAVDCFWLSAGFAIFGGYKTLPPKEAEPRSFTDALRSAQRALDRVEAQ